MNNPTSLLMRAVSFAARAHQGQLRKDGKTPYASHVFRVCLTLRHVFDVQDVSILTAAVLHDTLEDTTVDFDDLEKEFGGEIAGWVALLSKDTRLAEKPREAAYQQQIAAAPDAVKLIKLADMHDNILDAETAAPGQLERSFEKAKVMLKAVEQNASPRVQAAIEKVKAHLQAVSAKTS